MSWKLLEDDNLPCVILTMFGLAIALIVVLLVTCMVSGYVNQHAYVPTQEFSNPVLPEYEVELPQPDWTEEDYVRQYARLGLDFKSSSHYHMVYGAGRDQ